jgi:hypothetical protein
MAKLVHQFPQAGWYASGYVFRYAAGDRLPAHPGLEKFEAGLLENYFEVVARGDMVATASSVCIPKAVLDQLGGFPVNEKIGEDQDLWARIALQYPVAYDPKPLAIYEQEAEGMATRAKVSRQLWPFISRLAAMAPQQPAAVRQPLQRYLSRQLVGQASQLVLDGAFAEARQLLKHPLARLSGLRYGYWLLRTYLRH